MFGVTEYCQIFISGGILYRVEVELQNCRNGIGGIGGKKVGKRKGRILKKMRRGEINSFIMKFKVWLLDEAVQLIHQHKQVQDTEVIYLGKFGRFKTYYLYRKGGENRSAEVSEQMKFKSVKANDGLSSLGFPSNNITTIITDNVKSTIAPDINFGGYASRESHGIVLNYGDLCTNALVHEYAHAYFFNMPRVAKNLFINKYSEYLKDFTQSVEGFASIKAKLRRQFFDKIKQGKLSEFLIYELSSRYNKDKNDSSLIDFIVLPENAEEIITFINDKLVSWCIFNKIPLSAKDKFSAYDGSPIEDDDKVNYYISQFISGDKIYNGIIKNYKLYKDFNQHEGGLSSYINEVFFWDLLKSSDISRDVLQYYNKEDLGHYDDAGREAMAAKYNLPSPYSATNYHELWATVVEYAAMNLKSIDPKLKKLLVQTITMSR